MAGQSKPAAVDNGKGTPLEVRREICRGVFSPSTEAHENQNDDIHPCRWSRGAAVVLFQSVLLRHVFALVAGVGEWQVQAEHVLSTQQQQAAQEDRAPS